MDYKNIEQLLEKYWQCQTTLEEESLLRDFFTNSEVIPAHLLPYKSLFVYQAEQKEQTLGDDFDARVLAQIDEKPAVKVKAKRLTMMSRFRPLFRAAAVIAVFLMLGNVAQRTFLQNDALDYNYNTYKDTYDDPNMAYKKVSSALNILSQEINQSQSQKSDSIKAIPSDSVVNE
jgi:hypothetical protein